MAFEYLLEVISGNRRGLGPSLLKSFLSAAELPYAAAIGWRNAGYDRRPATVQGVPVPVISVGNITAGGTGKTPMVRWLAEWFRRHGVRVVIVSRGYRADAAGRNDEARELERQLPDVPHLQNPDRIAAARLAIEEFESQLILLDDAFQHRRIRRDLDLVLVDALQPFGYGHLLPRGLLREPLASLRRADAVAISRCNLVDAAELAAVKQTVRRHAPDAILCELEHEPQGWISAAGKHRPLESLTSDRIAAFCGIGNPEGFRKTLVQCGLQIAGFRTFADHYAFQKDDLADLAGWAASAGATAVACTAKDLVKLGVEQLGSLPLVALEIGIRFSAGEPALSKRLAAILEQIRDSA